MGAAASADPEVRARALDRLAAVYWRPLCSHFRFRWGLDEPSAEDLTQAFLADAVRLDLFGRFDPQKARFRTYLRTCADRYAMQARRREGRQKRGGGVAWVHDPAQGWDGDDGSWLSGASDVELESAAQALGVPPAEQPEAVYEASFHQAWVQSLFAESLAALEVEAAARGKPVPLAVFRAYDLHDADAGPRPTYAELAATHGIPVTQVTNHLAAMRRRFRELALATLGELCADESEFRAEARALFGVDSTS